MIRNRWALLPILPLVCSFAGEAAPLITPVGSPSNPFGISSISAGEFGAVAFTLDSDWSGVAIAASLVGVNSLASGTAHLTTRLGPGTTQAHQIAATNFQFAAVPNFSTLSYVSLFSGLNLPAATYYVVFSTSTSSRAQGLSVGDSVSYTTAPGVSVGVAQFAFAAPGNPPLDAGFPPATTWTNTATRNYFFTVTGNPVPEPGTALLLGASLLGLAVMRRRAG